MENKFYITTPIYYVNDKPHIGSAYTNIVADVLARWRQQLGEDVFFLTGTDEFSQKTVDAAKKNNEEVHEYIDRMAGLWQSTWEKLNLSNTDFIRTTEERHIVTVKDFWGRVDAAGDIYKGKYEGLYCKGHEAFMKEDELTEDGLCPDHKTKPEWISEENYFFKLSAYQEKLLAFYEEYPDFIAPANRFHEVKAFVARGLEDISISREGKSWGIPVPNDPRHVVYVWFDALINYISAVGVEGWEDHPADIHVMGKDITRFHAVIWPAMLMSAGLPLPGQILAHGFFTIDGTKMSKSLGNAIDPLEIAGRYGNDALRYFLLREIPFGEDGDFSEIKMKERYNGDLANGLGNFAARVLTLAEKEDFGAAGAASGVSDGGAGALTLDQAFDQEIAAMKKTVYAKTNEFRFHEALAAIWSAISFGDRYVNEEKLWAIKDAGVRRQKLFNTLTLLDAVATALLPFMPESSRKITAGVRGESESVKPKKIDILFPRLL